MSDENDDRYPAWRFHPTKPARIVQNEDEDQALGEGWLDSHLKLPKPDDPEPKEPDHTDMTTGPEPEPEAAPKPKRKAQK
jgi:hypothetical protein